MIVQIFPKKAKFGQIASSPRLFTPTCKYFYTNIFVIFVTFRNSALVMQKKAVKMLIIHIDVLEPLVIQRDVVEPLVIQKNEVDLLIIQIDAKRSF